MRSPEPPPERNSVMDGLDPGRPSLSLAREMAERAALLGFDWPDVAGVWDKIAEETAELRWEVEHGGSAARVEAELGDLIMALTNLSRFLGVDPEAGLRGTIRRFEARFRAMERAAAQQAGGLAALDLDEQESLWQAVKRSEPGT